MWLKVTCNRCNSSMTFSGPEMDKSGQNFMLQHKCYNKTGAEILADLKVQYDSIYGKKG